VSACENCGAPLPPPTGGRAVECEYCGPTSGRVLDPVFLASALHGAVDDIEHAAHALADKLVKTFPDRTQLETSGGLLSAKKLKLLQITLDPHHYRLRRDGHQVVAERVKVVRGVALKTTQLRFDEWIQELARDLAAMAADTAASRAALARFVRGG
jgi:hypothetical protein